ncbi:MAG: hypothetical protein AAF430_14370 [Myxococcota bacterium]
MSSPSSRRTGPRRLEAWLCLVLALLGSACVLPRPYRAPANQALRWSDIETVTLVPPLVSVAAMSSGDIEQEVQEWSDTANQNTRGAVQTYLESTGKIFVPYAGAHPPRPDFRIHPGSVNSRPQVSEGEQSWLLFESAKDAILRHTYDLGQLFPPQMENFDYTLGPEARALLAGTPADAFLLMIATDFIPTEDRAALIGVGAVAALATGSYAGPSATPAELIVALVESQTGDVLFFNKVSMPLADLRDPEASKALVDLVLTGMQP